MDGDALDDLVVSSSADDAVRVFFGRATWPASVDLAVAAADVTLTGFPNTPFARVADLTEDGLGDVAVLYPNANARVVLGRAPWPPSLDVQSAAGVLEIPPGTGNSAEIVVADVVDDATFDLVITDTSSGTRSRVFSGGPAFDTVEDLTVTGPGAGFSTPKSVAAADVDGDGQPDLVVADRFLAGARGRASGAGAVFVIDGRVAAGTLDLRSAAPDLEVHGARASDSLGSFAVGDLDGDGRPEVAIGAYGTDRPGATSAGAVHVFRGDDRSPGPIAGPQFVDVVLGDDSSDGASWATPKKTIEGALDALDLAPGPAVVSVAVGTYAGDLIVGRATTLLGGFPRGGGPRATTGPEPRIVGSGSGSSPVVTVIGGLGADATTIDHFVVTGGLLAPSGDGAGVHVVEGDVRLVGSVITGNVIHRTYFPSGGFCPTDPSFPDCFEGCGGAGAGVFVAAGSLEMLNDLVTGTSSSDPSCCCFSPCANPCPGASSSVVDVAGGASLTMRHVTVAPDQATNGVVVRARTGGATVTLTNNVLSGASTRDLNVDPAQPGVVIERNLVERAPAGLSSSNLTGVSPLFASGSYHLEQVAAGQAGDSPALDAASDPSSATCLPDPCLDALTTRTDLVPDAGTADLGYHYPVVARRPPAFAGAREVRVAGDCALEVSWDAAADPDGDDPVTYRVYRATTPGGQDFASPVATVGTLSYRDTNRTFATTYHYVVRARDATGQEETNTVEVSGTTEDQTAPGQSPLVMTLVPPCDVREQGRSSNSSCSPLAPYEFHRSALAGFRPDASTLLAVAPPFPFVDTVPGNGTWYYKRLLGDAAGNMSEVEAVVFVDACGGPPPRPGMALVGAVTKATVGVDVPITSLAIGADSHRLYRGDLPGLRTRAVPWDHGVTVGADGTAGTLDDTGSCVVPGTTASDPTGLSPGSFYYLVVGVNAAGEGPHGWDPATGGSNADATTGARDCP